MHKLLKNFLSNNLGSNAEILNVRLPKELKDILIKKSTNIGIDSAQYVRNVLCVSLFPEILNSMLQEEAISWITQQGLDSIEIHFGKKINKLKEIIENAEYAIKQTSLLQQQFLDAEVECLNKISEKITPMNKER